MQVSLAVEVAKRSLQTAFVCLRYLLVVVTASVLECQYLNTSGSQIVFNLNFSSTICLRE